MGAPVFHTYQVVTALVWPMLYGSYQKVLHSNTCIPKCQSHTALTAQNN